MEIAGYILAAAALIGVGYFIGSRWAWYESAKTEKSRSEARARAAERHATGNGFILDQGDIARHKYPRPTPKRWVRLHRGDFRKEAIGDDYQSALKTAIEGEEFTKVDAFDTLEAGEVWEYTSEGKRTIQMGNFRAFRLALISLDQGEG